MFLPLRPGRFLTQASSRLSHQAVCKLHSINQPLKTRTYTLWINIWKAVRWNAGLFSCTILCMTLVCTLLIPINPSVSYQHQQDYQQRPSEEVTEDNRETLQITFVSVQKFECFYARCWMCTQYQCKHFFFFPECIWWCVLIREQVEWISGLSVLVYMLSVCLFRSVWGKDLEEAPCHWSNQPRWAMNWALSLYALLTPVYIRVCVWIWMWEGVLNPTRGYIRATVIQPIRVETN